MVMPATKIVNAISRGAEILKILAEGHNRLEDIFPIVGLNKSTTHRLLKSLVSSGLAFQNPLNRNYYLGPLFLRLSSNPSVSHQMLILSSMDELRKLRDSSDETSMITIPNGDQRLVLKEVCSKQKIALSLGDGNSAPIYVGSAGRTILAQYSDNELNKILGRIRVAPFGLSPFKDESLLRKEINKIRKKGFSTSLGENHPDAAGISVPVIGYFIPVSLCVMGLKRRFKPTSILDELKESAIRISDSLLQGI
jgi:DNA-binding IclR family transcriptional regulator